LFDYLIRIKINTSKPNHLIIITSSDETNEFDMQNCKKKLRIYNIVDVELVIRVSSKCP